MNPPRKTAAFSLLEVMCAVLILGLGGAGMTHGVATALRSSKEAELQTQAALMAAGFSETEAAYYRRRNDEAAMAQLYLRDQAEREGWIRTPRYFEALQEIRSDLESIRDEMDDEAYARYLYAVGRPNQVTVQRVLFDPPHLMVIER